MKKRLVCRMGVHHPTPSDKVELYRVNSHYFDIVEKCSYCGEYVTTGSIETPPPLYMNNWNFVIINE